MLRITRQGKSGPDGGGHHTPPWFFVDGVAYVGASHSAQVDVARFHRDQPRQCRPPANARRP
jgi:hypothetical protein